MADTEFAVVGETIELYVETEAPFSGDVVVSFAAEIIDEVAKTQDLSFFEERLTAVPTAVRSKDAPPGTVGSTIAWKVNVGGVESFRGRTATLTFTVDGDDRALGLPLRAVSRNTLRVVSIGVTESAPCHRIMLHEFPKSDGGTIVRKNGKPVLDLAHLDAVVDGLSVAQRRLLLSHARAKPDGRLVVFITFMPPGERRMCADYTGSPEAVAPNASFAVYACRDPEQEGISLVCYTEHFLLNLRNEPTRDLINSAQGGKAPKAWRHRDNPKPPQFRIASQFPEDENDGLIWSCLFSPNGRNVMKGNTIHGLINTVGCWMLFRNFNWPIGRTREFERVLLNMRGRSRAGVRGNALWNAVEKDLIPLGYDRVKSENGESASLDKFATYDKNFAYFWFFHDIVGIKYFARGWTYGAETPVVHDFDTPNVEGRVTFPLAEAGKPSPTNTPDEGNCTTHDTKYRRMFDLKKPPVVPVDNTLWRANALGFQTAKQFIPAYGRYGDLSAADLDACAWADVYIYDS